MTANPITITPFMPDGRPAPFLMTEKDLAEFLRLDTIGIKYPEDTIRRLRELGLLKGTQVSKGVFYRLTDVLEALDKLHERNPR